MRSPIARFALLVAFVAIGLVAVYQLGLLDWLRDGTLQERVLSLRDHWWTPLAVIGLFVLSGCLPLPSTAVVLTAGAVYGPVQGWGLNVLGLVIGSVAGFGVARGLGHGFVVRILGPERWERVDGLMTEHGFWAMVRARWMLPLAVVSYGGGLAGMRVLPYTLSTVIGVMVPAALYTYVGHLLVSAAGADATRTITIAGSIVFAILLLSLIGPVLRFWQRRRQG